MDKEYDFSGYATKNDILCTDGRIIRKDAFKHNDGKKVPLVWNHSHNDVEDVLGHAILENRNDGVYAYCTFNDTPKGKYAKSIVRHGDVDALSIWANQLKQRGPEVIHGDIKEVSLVLAGANIGASIQEIMVHGEIQENSGVIFSGEHIVLSHSDDNEDEDIDDLDSEEDDEDENKEVEEEKEVSEDLEHADKEDSSKDILSTFTEKQKNALYGIVGMILEGKDDSSEIKHADDEKSDESDGETLKDILDTLNEEQKDFANAVIEKALEEAGELDQDEEDEESEGGKKEMSHNVFDQSEERKGNVLSHSDEMAIINMAKQSNVGTFQTALQYYAEENELQHAADTVGGFIQTGEAGNVTELFPEYKDVRPGMPDLITNDQGWISTVLRKVHKSPISRIRTRHVDIRNIQELRAKGYKKGNQKKLSGNFKLVTRTTDPQTIYVRNSLHRDDIVDITDFDYVQYLYNIDKMMLNEELATAIMLGDGRDEGVEDKIDETHIRPIWLDDDLYTLHVDLDVEKAKAELQGTGTGVSFGENYITAEAMVNTVLYAREKFKGSGQPDFYCTPHMVNVMLLARDMNGRRIYSSVQELATALNVASIQTAEQFEGKERTTTDAKKKKLVGIICNLADYSLGATKGGEVTHFTQFDIDFNQQKSLLETRVSGALTRVYSAIAIEEDITSAD